jgi:hypothetical protein
MRVMETLFAILFTYPALTGFVLALIVLAIVLRTLKWAEDRKPRVDLHSGPDDVEKRARRAF